MGGVTDFLFGKPSKQTSSNSSSSSSDSSNQAYGTLSQALSPTLGYGAQAGNMMGALLGLPSSSPATPAPAPSSNPSVPQYNPTYNPTPYGNPEVPTYGGNVGANNAYGYKQSMINNADSLTDPSQKGGIPYIYGTPPETLPQSQSQPQTAPTVSQTPVNPVTGGQAGSALDDFSNSAGMDFLRNQGVKAIEASQAGKGMLQSGATGQALSSFGNNLAKTYLNDYLTHLTDYANIGTKNAGVLSAAGSQSSSTGLSSGTGNANGGKAGLLNTLAGNSGLGGAIAAFA